METDRIMTFYIHDSRYTEFNSKTASANIASGTKVITNWTKTHVSQGFKKNLVVTFADTRQVSYHNYIDISGLTTITITNAWAKQDSYSQEWHHGAYLYYRLNNGPWIHCCTVARRTQYGYFSDITISNSGNVYKTISIKVSGWVEQGRGRGNTNLSFSATVSSWVDTSYDESTYTSTEVPSDGNTQTECEIVQSGSYTQSDQIWVKKKGKWEHVHEVYVRENNEWKPVLYEDKYKSYTIPDTTVDYRVPHGVFNLKYDLIGGTGGGQTGWSQVNGASGVPGEVKSEIIPVTPGGNVKFKVGRDGITNPSPPNSYGYPSAIWPARSKTPLGEGQIHDGGSPGTDSTISFSHQSWDLITSSGGASGRDYKGFNSAGSFIWYVPQGVYQLTIDAVGGGGGGYGTHDGDYGRFAYISGSSGGVKQVQLTVYPGAPLQVFVGTGGGHAGHWTGGGAGTHSWVSFNGEVIFIAGSGSYTSTDKVFHNTEPSWIKSGISGIVYQGTSSGGPFHTCCDNNACGGNPYQFTSYWCDYNASDYVTPALINNGVPLGGTGSQDGWVSIRWGGSTSTIATVELTQLP